MKFLSTSLTNLIISVNLFEESQTSNPKNNLLLFSLDKISTFDLIIKWNYFYYFSASILFKRIVKKILSYFLILQQTILINVNLDRMF